MERSGDNYTMHGDLTIKDITEGISLDYEHNGSVVDPYGNTKVGGTLTGTIERSRWGLKWNVPLGGGGLLVGEKVKLEIDGELGQEKGQRSVRAGRGESERMTTALRT